MANHAQLEKSGNGSSADNDFEWFDLEDSKHVDSDHAHGDSGNEVDTDNDLEWLESLSLNDTEKTSPSFADNSSRPPSPRMPLPHDLNADEELLNPKAREAKIKRVQAVAVANSAFHLLVDRQEKEDDRALPSQDQKMPRIRFPSQSFHGYVSQDTEMWNPFGREKIVDGDSAYMATLWHTYTGSNTISEESPEPVVMDHNDVHILLGLHRDLLESRNLLVRVCCNIHELCQSGICQGLITIIVISDSRPGVASLQSVNVDQVYKFTQLIDTLLHALYWTLGRKTTFPKVEQGVRGDVQTFMSNLGKLGDFFEAEVLAPGSRVGLQAIVDICRVIGHVLDLALLAYCGAHLLALDQTFLDRHIERFEIHHPVLLSGPQAQSPAVVVRRRSLSCLDKFLRGKKVWVFHYGLTNGSSASSNVKLYLSTSIEAFADTWGPVWKVSRKNSIGNAVLRYSVAIGAIIPWTRILEREPEALPEEAFCHWTCSDEDDSDLEMSPTIDIQKHPLLLIGGAPKLTISPNTECRADPVSLLHTLKCQDCLQRCGTVKPHRYKDTEAAQVQVGHGGVQVGGSVQWKTNPGITWKEYFVKSWKNEPQRRNPKLLEHWCGVEVSLCTFNARRRRLLQILGSKSMRNHLSNIFFIWSDPLCEEAYYSALHSEDLHAFYNLYVSCHDWRLELGTAVSLCFEMLLHTGLDDRGDLKVFYAPTSSGDQDWLAVIRNKKHNWAGLLKDSEQCATMAVATETCLEASTRSWPKFPGQQCRQRPKQGDQFSLLETKLVCLRTSEGRTFGDTHLPDSTLSFGSSGLLEVLIQLKRDGLLVRWKSRAPLLGKARELVSVCGPHSEHMEDQYLKAKSSELYVVSRSASKLSPVDFRPLHTLDRVQDAHADDSNLDHPPQDRRVQSVESNKECTNTTVRVLSATSSIAGEAGDSEPEDRDKRYVEKSVGVYRCIYLPGLEAETMVFGTTSTHLSTNTKAEKTSNLRPFLIASLS